jgi:DNA-binding HxlR family transcriptional regulator
MSGQRKANRSVQGTPDVLPLAAGLEVLGDPWSFLIMQEAFLGIRRFDDFQRNLKIARNTLTDRLKRLVRHGVLTKRPYQINPIRHEYRLTVSGLESYPYAVMLMAWGDKWLKKRGLPFLKLHHLNCGASIAPICLCDVCRTDASAENVVINPATALRASGAASKVRYSSKPELYAQGRDTSVPRTLALIGDRWGFFVLWLAFAGISRPDQFHRILGIARMILANRLQRLTANGILQRKRYSDKPVRYDYPPTAKGAGLLPALLVFYDWSRRWFGTGHDALPGVLHKTCGKPLHVVIACAHCRQELKAREVRFELIPYQPPKSRTVAPVKGARRDKRR